MHRVINVKRDYGTQRVGVELHPLTGSMAQPNDPSGAETGLPAGADAADRTWQGHHQPSVDGNQTRYPKFKVAWAE